jgi:hypothetical protein
LEEFLLFDHPSGRTRLFGDANGRPRISALATPSDHARANGLAAPLNCRTKRVERELRQRVGHAELRRATAATYNSSPTSFGPVEMTAGHFPPVCRLSALGLLAHRFGTVSSVPPTSLLLLPVE